MKTITYTNSNGDIVLIDIKENIIEAVYLFGVNILARLTNRQLAYLYKEIV